MVLSERTKPNFGNHDTDFFGDPRPATAPPDSHLLPKRQHFDSNVSAAAEEHASGGYEYEDQ